MMHILKYTILDGLDMRQGLREVLLPKGCRLLHVDEQHDRKVHVWVSGNADDGMVKRVFDVCHTGYADPRSGSEKWKHVGTVLHSGGLVLHVFLLDEDWKGDPQTFGKVIRINSNER